MKKQLFIGLLVTTIGLSSCSKWLDVEPKSIIEENDLFNTETGFCSSAETESFIEGEEAGYVFE